MNDDPAGRPADRPREIDVRVMPRAERHPHIFEVYRALAVGEALIVVSDHEPRRLREELDHEWADSFTWETELSSREQREHRVRITKRARTPLPRLVGDTTALIAAAGPDASGAIWRLEPDARGLDANVIALPPGGEIRRHDGPDLDVLLHVLDGAGELETEAETIPLRPGELVWLPRNAQRRIVAGPDGVRYFSVHQRKPALSITAAPGGAG